MLWSLISTAGHSAKRTTAALDAAYGLKFGREGPNRPHNQDDFSGAFLDHRGIRRAAGIDSADQIHIDHIFPILCLRRKERADGNPRTAADEIKTSTRRRPRACGPPRRHLFQVAHVRTNAEAFPPACSISSLAKSSSAASGLAGRHARLPVRTHASRLPIPRPAPVIKTLLSRMTFKDRLTFRLWIHNADCNPLSPSALQPHGATARIFRSSVGVAKWSCMSIRNQAQLEKLRVIGRIVRRALDRTAEAVRPGVTTAELDRLARVLAEHGAVGPAQGL